MDNLSESYLDVISDHRRWLKVFGEQRLQRWEALLGHNPEAAICEAYVRMLLAEYVETVEPNEDLVDGGPDFFCNQNNSNHFYVEVTCMSISTVTRITGLDHPLPRDSGSQYFGLLTRKILGEICNKASQCSDMNAPCVLAIGTLHTHAGHICMNKRAAEQLLTGTSFITIIDSDGNRRKAFFPYATTGPDFDITIEIEYMHFSDPQKNKVNICIISTHHQEEVDTWRQLYGIDERYNDKCCSSDSKYWLEQINEAANYNKDSATFIDDQIRFGKNNPLRQYNFLKVPFLKAYKRYSSA